MRTTGLTKCISPTTMAAAIRTVPVKFLILSDTHDLDLEVALKAVYNVDVVLHCGDMTNNGGCQQYEKVLRGLASMNAELKLVIAGNHDVDLDRDFYYQKQGGAEEHYQQAHQLWNSPLARDNGIFYLEEGTHQFILQSGAVINIYATPYQPEYGASAFQYPTNQDRYNNSSHTPSWATNCATNASIIPPYPKIDIVMSHGPPKYILDRTADGSSAGCEHLRRAICTAKPLLHCFGHVHDGWGARRVLWKTAAREAKNPILLELDDWQEDDMLPLDPEFVMVNSSRRRGHAALSVAATEAVQRGRQTLMINAAIENVEGKAKNVPWLVELQLPVAPGREVKGKERITKI